MANVTERMHARAVTHSGMEETHLLDFSNLVEFPDGSRIRMGNPPIPCLSWPCPGVLKMKAFFLGAHRVYSLACAGPWHPFGTTGHRSSKRVV